MTEKSELTLDLDAIWEALTRSTQMKAKLEQAAQQVSKEAASIARVVAFDEGFYADLFSAGSDSAQSVRRRARNDPNLSRARRRRGQVGTNRFLDTTLKGDPDGKAYNGIIAAVVNTDFKAFWVEYGSLAKGPRRVLMTAADRVAQRLGGEVEVLYDRTFNENRSELARKISEGKRR